MFEIDVKNNKFAINELLGDQSKFLDPETVDILKMFKNKKQNRQKLFRDKYYALSFDAY
jgi:hypothetical protein